VILTLVVMPARVLGGARDPPLRDADVASWATDQGKGGLVLLRRNRLGEHGGRSRGHEWRDEMGVAGENHRRNRWGSEAAEESREMSQ
jgi:hypothetical protein